MVVEIWQHNGILNVVLLFPINSMSVGQRASNLHENHMQMQPTFRSPRLRAVEALPNFSFLCGSLSYQQCAISLSRPFFQDFQPRHVIKNSFIFQAILQLESNFRMVEYRIIDNIR